MSPTLTRTILIGHDMPDQHTQPELDLLLIILTEIAQVHILNPHIVRKYQRSIHSAMAIYSS